MAVERRDKGVRGEDTILEISMNTATLNGLLHTKAPYDSATCYNFKLLSSHLSMMTEEIYKTEDPKH